MRGRPPRPHGWNGRNEIAIRIATLMRLLSHRSVMPAIAELARELEVHPRTITRDLRALEAAYWPLPPLPREATADLFTGYPVSLQAEAFR